MKKMNHDLQLMFLKRGFCQHSWKKISRPRHKYGFTSLFFKPIITFGIFSNKVGTTISPLHGAIMHLLLLCLTPLNGGAATIIINCCIEHGSNACPHWHGWGAWRAKCLLAACIYMCSHLYIHTLSFTLAPASATNQHHLSLMNCHAALVLVTYLIHSKFHYQVATVYDLSSWNY